MKTMKLPAALLLLLTSFFTSLFYRKHLNL
jgi:hypothetical protein